MKDTVLLATEDGAFAWCEGCVERLGLEGKALSLIVPQPDDVRVLHAGAWEDGVYRSTDGGATWTQVLAADVWTLCQRPERTEFLYAGVEPAGVYRSSDWGQSWVELDGVYKLPTYKQWWFPPAPHIAHVTSFVMHPMDVRVLYAGVEIGGVNVTRDGGRTWYELRNGVHDDIHAMTWGWNPHSPPILHATNSVAQERGGGVGGFVLFAATQQGVYRSDDEGASWQRLGVGRGLDKRYGYAIACLGQDAQKLLLVASSDSYARDSVLFRSEDGGENWTKVMDALPSAEIEGRMKLVAVANGTCYLSLPAGVLYRSTDAGASWHELARGLPYVYGMTAR